MEVNERRKFPRVVWKGEVRLVIPGFDPVDATIADISEIGCGLDTSHAVAPGVSVGIDGTGFEGCGLVRYCYPTHCGYRVGIELTPVC